MHTFFRRYLNEGGGDGGGGEAAFDAFAAPEPTQTATAGSDDPLAGTAMAAEPSGVQASAARSLDGTPDHTTGAPVDESFRHMIAGLPDNLRGNPALQNVRSLQDMSEQLIHAQAALGHNVAVPGRNATQQERDAFYAKLGRPDTPDGYVMPRELPEGAPPMNDARMAHMRQAMHDAGITRQQFARLVHADTEFMMQHSAGSAEAIARAKSEGIQTLRSEWGTAFDQNMEQARAATMEFGDRDFTDALSEANLMSDPRVIRFLQRVGAAVADDAILGTTTANNPDVMDPKSAQMEIDRLMADNEFIERYNNKRAAGHDEAVAKMQSLEQMASPSDDGQYTESHSERKLKRARR